MDINKLLSNVTNVDEYKFVTQEIANNCKNITVHINITIVLALKKIKYFEIEYFNNLNKNGAACILFERLLSFPPSKTWGVLGKELVSLLQYWLEAIRKDQINHTVHWWSFLKQILKFIKDICPKDPSMPNILVELTAECLFDIASKDNPDPQQRYQILHCLNAYCAESSREIRFAMRNKFGEFFNKLASHLSTSGYHPCQYSILEALVRWLVPRQDRRLRTAAAARWFPQDLWPDAAREIFLTANWINFFQDARDFLNVLNQANGLVTSVVCRRLSVGKIIIISGAETQQTWIDINSSGKSISVLLSPRVLEIFGVMDYRTYETLMIANENTQTARLHSLAEEITISLNTIQPLRVQPLDVLVGHVSEVNIVVSSSVDLEKLDAALRSVFGEKYRLLLDFNELPLSPPKSQEIRNNLISSEEDTRFSHPVEVKRKRRAGYMIRPKHAGPGLVSPSTASTSSLAQLHDKLEALPRYRYNRELVSVCAQPALSSVTEISEVNDRSFQSRSTLKFKQIGVCYNNRNNNAGQLAEPTKKRAESDSETLNLKPELRRHLSPVVSDDDSVSCLLVATVGSADDSVINDTVERISKSKEFNKFNIVDLLVQEALEAKPIIKEKLVDSGINSVDNKSEEKEKNSEAVEAIENTPIQDDDEKTRKKNKVVTKKICNIVSKSTIDDESNTEVINETPALVYPKKSNLSRGQSFPKAIQRKVSDKQSFDIRTVEEFFSQHFTETKAGEIVISPTLARKINESSSETSENFDENSMNEGLNADVEQFEFNDLDILECLNNMVDKVCSEFEKCTKYLSKDDDLVVSKNDSGLVDNQTHMRETSCTNTSLQQTDTASKPKEKNIKLMFKPKKGRKPRAVPKKGKNISEKDLTKKMSTIIEQKDEEALVNNSLNRHVENVEVTKMISPVKNVIENLPPVEKNNVATPVTKRKRKLYSPKDDEIKKEKGVKISETEDDDIVLSELKRCNKVKTFQTTATCYKEIERERQKRIRLPRSRKCRGTVEELPSPRFLKMNAVFDKLKATVDGEKNIIFASKMTAQSDIYNYNVTSESEEEDFKKKKFDLQKRTSTTTVGSFESTMSTRPGRQRTRTNYSEKSSNDVAKKTTNFRRKKATKKTNSKSKSRVNIESDIELKDEIMRGAGPDALNTSIVIDNPKTNKSAKVELALHVPPEMELISDNPENRAPEKKKPSKKMKKAEMLSLKKEKVLKNDELKLVSDKEDDRTVSPLPGLVVESMPTHQDEANDSVTGTMLQKFKKIFQEGPNVTNESSNTQNILLSDFERFNNSPQNVCVDITDEICFGDCNKENIKTETEKKKAEKRKTNTSKTEYFKTSPDRKNFSLSKDKSRDVIEISELSNDKSEKSIATDGITAHGDFDEAPPSPEMIRERMQPREIEDLNESMKNYFLKLNHEIYDSASKKRRESSKSKEDAQNTHIIQTVLDESASVKSPIVSVQRLLFDDISKWLPSRRSSDDSSSAKSSENIHKTSEPVKINTITKSSLENVQKKIPVNNVSKERNKQQPNVKKNQQVKPIVNSPEIKSPLVTAKISFEEFNNWLPMPRSLQCKDEIETNKSSRQSGVTLVYNTRQKSKNTKNVKILEKSTTQNKSTKLKPDSKKRTVLDKIKPKGIENTTNHTSEIDSDFTSNRVCTRNRTKNFRMAMKNKGTVVKNTNDSESDDHSEVKAEHKRSSEKNNTIISPIKSFEDFVTNIYNDESGEDQCIKKIRDIFSKESVKTKITDTVKKLKDAKKMQSLDSTSTKIKFMTSQDSIRKETRAQNSTSSKENDIEHESISTTVDELLKSKIKRNSSPILGWAKKMRSEEKPETVTIESGPSITSVKDWFRRNEPSTSNANDTNESFKDVMQNIMEKLDTTLVENNLNTSKKMINLFVEAQKQLTEMQEERRKTIKTVATQIITDMVSVMDAKFADLDKRSQEMDTEFREHLKKQAFELIREDCNKKRAMVLLLKEDVQAVLDHIGRTRSSP